MLSVAHSAGDVRVMLPRVEIIKSNMLAIARRHTAVGHAV